MDVAVHRVACHVNTWKCFATPEDSKIEPTPEIHAKVLRSSATQATCAQALVIWNVFSFPQFSLRCCQRVERSQSSIGGGTVVARGTNRAHNGSEDCQDAGSNCTPHRCVRCRTLRWPHSASSDSVSLRTSSSRLGVSNTQLRIALQSADISSEAQRVLSSTVRCVEHCDIIVVQVVKNVWIRMYKSVSSSMPTSQDCAVILSSSSSHTSWTVEFCISRCGSSSTAPSIKRNLAP